MKTIKLLIPSILIIALTILSIQSCKKKDKEIDVKASGFVQKGPFVSGSQITIQELDNTLTPTGDVYQTTINDDFGSFSLNSTINSHYIEVIAIGYYFNEVSGTLSSGPLTLRALADPDDTAKININILTTLAKSRIEYLMNELGLPFVAARTHAEMEILAIFNINIPNLTSFSEMNIAEPGVSNAILLAISATLQADNSVAELSELISKISLDIKEDGDIDDQNITDEIRENGKSLLLIRIRDNIENRYSALGLSVTIPEFEDYLDLDGDGIINMNDTDQYVLKQVAFNSPFIDREEDIILYNNKLWMLGGDFNNTKIWSSTDGINWQYETDGPWQPNYHLGCLVYNNLMWLFNPNYGGVWKSDNGLNWVKVDSANIQNCGYTSEVHTKCQVFNNKMFFLLNDYSYNVYSSTDGLIWNKENVDQPWGNRAHSSTFIFNNKLWIYGGVDNGPGLNDLWNSDNGVDWTNIQSVYLPQTGVWNTIEVFNNKVWVTSNIDLWVSNDGVNYKFCTLLNNPLNANTTLMTCIFNNEFWIYSGSGIYKVVKYSDY